MLLCKESGAKVAFSIPSMLAHHSSELIRRNLSRVVDVVALEAMPDALETFRFHNKHHKFRKIQGPAVVDIHGVNQ
jgi:hypothetical protein